GWWLHGGYSWAKNSTTVTREAGEASGLCGRGPPPPGRSTPDNSLGEDSTTPTHVCSLEQLWPEQSQPRSPQQVVGGVNRHLVLALVHQLRPQVRLPCGDRLRQRRVALQVRRHVRGSLAVAAHQMASCLLGQSVPELQDRHRCRHVLLPRQPRGSIQPECTRSA